MAVKSSIKNIKAQLGKIANLLDDDSQASTEDPDFVADLDASTVFAVDGEFGESVDDGLVDSFDSEFGSGDATVEQLAGYADDRPSIDMMDDEHRLLETDDDGWVLPSVVNDTDDAFMSPPAPDTLHDGDGFSNPETAFVDVSPVEGAIPATEPEAEFVSQVEVDGKPIRDRVVNRLVTLGIVTIDQIRDSLDEWDRVRKQGYHVALWRVLTLIPNLDRERIFAEAASVYRFPHGNVNRREALLFIEKIVNVFADDDISRMLELFVIPVGQEVDRRSGEIKWIMATHDPTRPEVHKLLRELNLKRFELYYASESLIGGLITEGFLSKNEYLERLNDNPLVYDISASLEDKEELVDDEELEAEINRSSLINLFEATLVEAVNVGASDIHVFPNPDAQIEIHFRVDGQLEMWHREERIHPEAFLAVVKDKSKNVDRFEKDTAQDGFIQRRISGTVIRFRVSILPIASHRPGVNAESIVIRVLDDRKVLTDLRGVGMLDSALDRFKQAIHQPHGMVILTGPTGSGKSTTLVAALHQVISPKVNVLTIEDPVEYLIRGIRQVKLSHHLNMEQALRALLRHDPDIVMVGEMRDKDTAELAIKLANTGHLTFSTLHTNDAPSAVSRLFKMGIEPFLIAYAINIVVAQRLIRKLCPSCKVKKEPDEQLLKFLGFSEQEMNETEFMVAGRASDCPTCSGQGFKGRRAVAETLFFSDAIRRQILASGEAIDEASIREQAESEGMLSLLDSAKEIVKMGDTSVEEMMRITGS